MNTVRFLQFSDLHLGRGFESGRLRLDPDIQEQVRKDRLTALDRIAELVHAESIEIVLVPGDLFEEDRVTEEEIRKTRSILARMEPVPVVILPGNRDYYSPLTWYRSERMEDHQLSPWPDHVHVLPGPDYRVVQPLEDRSLSVIGRGYTDNSPVEERPLDSSLPSPDTDLSILLHHGSFEPRTHEEKLLTAPFNREEILDLSFSVACLGHEHETFSIENEAGIIRGICAGSPVPVNLYEEGRRNVVIGDISPEGISSGDLEYRQISPRHSHRIQLRETIPDSGPELVKTLSERFEKKGVREEDLLFVDLPRLRTDRDILASDAVQTFRERHFSISFGFVDDPDVLESDVPEEEPRTTEQRFVRRMKERIRNASNDRERHLAQKALRLGKIAFSEEEPDLNNEI